ncbi:methyl-accepting chemotaxis protein [Gayadomonas joobiniege]|uniref:methyl-accepting chemotaxis protein n=1 Tax=Gayadomonas joobiniege TaxID=1234606 RepID=UPI000377FA65|nr:methyl-accepting chemotaxis protein [Gayadomonas joobiniege]
MNVSSIRFKSTIPSLALGFTLVLVFFSFSYLMKLQTQALDAQSEKFLNAISVVLNADRDLYQAHTAQLNAQLNSASLDANQQVFDENVSQVRERVEQFRHYMQDYPEVVTRLSEFENSLQNWLQLRAANSTDFSQTEKSSELAAFEQVRGLLDSAGEAAEQASVDVITQLRDESQAFVQVAAAGIIIILLVVAWLSYSVPKKLAAQINQLTEKIHQIARGDGDLSSRLVVEGQDEFAKLANEFNGFVENLRRLIRSVLEQSTAMNRLTDTLKESSETTREVTGVLNNASDSIVSAVHEMNLANKEMAQVATDTASEAENSSNKARQGQQIIQISSERISDLSKEMQVARDATDVLEENSQKIASVLNVIRDIAEQTNLLALNAAIEAARAGEQGRGFAVVADEVRTLATRTQDSTNDIRSMIEQLEVSVAHSANAVTDGQQHADSALESFSEASLLLNDMLKSSDRVHELSVQTAQATEEQTCVAEEISQNLYKLNEESEHASDIAKTAESLANEISQLSDNLNQLVGKFKL